MTTKRDEDAFQARISEALGSTMRPGRGGFGGFAARDVATQIVKGRQAVTTTNGSLADLLRHCRVSEKKSQTLARTYHKRNCRVMAEASERAAEQWQARGDALAELMAKAESEARP